METVSLPGGGVVAFEEHGCATGVPTLFLHGTPGSRHSAGWILAPDDPVRRAARLICVDRPGTGESTPGPRGFEPGVRALAAVADALQLKRFHVFAVSGGAAFGLLLAAHYGDRVDRLLVACGALPLDRRDRVLMARGGRTAQAVCRYAPTLARTLMTRSRSAPQDRTTAPMPPPDQLVQARLSADPARRAAQAADVRAVLASRAAGAVNELGTYGRSWSLRPDEVRVPVMAWHGDQDDAAPLGPTRAFITGTATGAMTVVEGGHLAPLLHTAQIAHALAAG